MATSGSKNFSVTRNDIIYAALRKLGEFDSAETPGGDETADASFALNYLVKEYVAQGADIWLRTELTLFIQNGQESYSIGTSGDNVTSSFAETTLDGAQASGATSMTVDSIAGISAGDYVGVKVDDGSIHWTTVNGAPAGTTVVLTTGIDDDAADGNKLYAYTTKSYRPHSIFYASRRDLNDYDVPVDLIGDDEYRFLAHKGQSGAPNQAHYRATLDNGTLFVWPTGDGSADKILLTAEYYPDDFDAASDNPEFPIEWTSALVFGLATELAPEYGIPRLETKDLRGEAYRKLQVALDFDVEDASVEFVVANQGVE